jgi:hypothetical protein
VHVGSGPTVLTGTGVLVFAVNDDLLGDNSGFTVTVSYSCWPGWGYRDANHDHCGPPGLVGKGDTRTSSEQAAQHGNGPSHEGNGKAVGRKADL